MALVQARIGAAEQLDAATHANCNLLSQAARYYLTNSLLGVRILVRWVHALSFATLLKLRCELCGRNDGGRKGPRSPSARGRPTRSPVAVSAQDASNIESSTSALTRGHSHVPRLETRHKQVQACTPHHEPGDATFESRRLATLIAGPPAPPIENGH